jgi:alginate O-acetyltransferase complex protein AlgI
MFWRRWHISLSTWLKEYLYISLGGNRGTRLATYRNLIITMLLGGLWHGASWNFVVWGALHGGALAFHKWWRTGSKPDAGHPRWIMTLISTAVTFAFVCFAWIFFRSPDFGTAVGVLSRLAAFEPPRLFPQVIEWAVLPLIFVHWLGYAGWSVSRFAGPIGWRFSIAYGFAWAVCLMVINLDYHPFIYF